MIAVRLQGRLGNQMFQYAFILISANQLNTSFYLDQYIYISVLDKYFDGLTGITHQAASCIFNIKGYKNLFNYHLRKKSYRFLEGFHKLAVKDYQEQPGSSPVIASDKSLYLGFFQSENFFKGHEKLIRKKFSLKQGLVNQFEKKYGDLYRNNFTVTVHIRRTDYQNLAHLNLGGDDLSLPLAYYKKAIARFNGQSVHFVFISDDLPFVQDNFGYIAHKTISADTEINDFQHLLNADACIISNSTFSWWGAWLNKKANTLVYAPKYFLGWRIQQQTPAEIYPDNWIQLDF
ncbi:hypothetical protein A0256_10535 [Mucilaginibacter sp. PAMC 26640]|nr:hypothetical protein A0256_10535 [Mucilaginibacter sp. PAMC 26640]